MRSHHQSSNSLPRLIRVKRKRNEEPKDNILIELPPRKKQLSIVQHFSHLGLSQAEHDTSSQTQKRLCLFKLVKASNSSKVTNELSFTDSSSNSVKGTSSSSSSRTKLLEPSDALSLIPNLATQENNSSDASSSQDDYEDDVYIYDRVADEDDTRQHQVVFWESFSGILDDGFEYDR